MSIQALIANKALDCAASELDKRQPWLARQHLITAWKWGRRTEVWHLGDLPSRFASLFVRKAIVETEQRDSREHVDAKLGALLGLG